MVSGFNFRPLTPKLLRMSKPIFKRHTDHMPDDCRPGFDMLYVLGDKWTVPVLGALTRDGRVRFTDIEKALPISQRMLTLTLRTLERDGLVQREVFASVPPRVEYELTERGHTLMDSLRDFAAWGFANHDAIQESRRQFDDGSD